MVRVKWSVTLFFVGNASAHVRSGKSQNERFPNFSNFRPEFCPEFCSEVSRIFRGLFVLHFVGDGDQKKFTKNPRHFSMQNSQANTKKIFTKFLWRAGKVNLPCAKHVRGHQDEGTENAHRTFQHELLGP